MSNTPPIEPAALSFTDDGVPWSERYRDIYHPRAGAFRQARHVFIAGNGLPQRWQGRDEFVILETGFGLGNNFLATWQAWRDDPARCERLVLISVEAHPLTREELGTAHATSPAPELAAALQAAWPPLTPNLHSLSFDDGRVRLLLALGDVQAWLPELIAQVDAFYLDGFAPASNPRMWDERVCKALSRLAAPGATLATWTAAHALREHLTTAGFEVQLGQGTGGKRDITLGHYAPRFTPRRAARAAARPSPAQHAVVIGGGLAGCAAAWALAEQGWRTTLLERHAQIASEASGNPAGLFHGIVNAQDGVHARFNRAAALMAREAIHHAIEHHAVPGATAGLLRLEGDLLPTEMHATLARLGLPADYVQALDAQQASNMAGLPLQQAAWFYPAGGWVQPAGLARAWLAQAGERVTLRTNVHVHALSQVDTGWRVLDADGGLIAESATIVLANAGDAVRLLNRNDWPIEPVRGQISLLDAPTWPLPCMPIAGAGYLLPAIDGRAMFGATAQRGDDDPAVRTSDHEANIAQLQRLLGRAVEITPDALQGRTAWRWSAVDRLPLIGAVPDTQAPATRSDHPRFVPRVPGLFVFTALGSRGITWSALGARLLASAVTGSPAPLEASLVDAVDPARFVSRAVRRAARR